MADQAADIVSKYGLCPSWALSVGYLGVASAAVLSNFGSAVSHVASSSEIIVSTCLFLEVELDLSIAPK